MKYDECVEHMIKSEDFFIYFKGLNITNPSNKDFEYDYSYPQDCNIGIYYTSSNLIKYKREIDLDFYFEFYDDKEIFF